MLGLACTMAGWTTLAAAGGWPDLSHPPKGNGTDGRADAAVLVGIEDYAHLADIPGATVNVEDWYRWMAKTRGVPLSRIHRLEDDQAIDRKIRAEVEKAAGEVQAGGTLWFVFIGHGVPAQDGQDAPLLVGADAGRSAAGIYRGSVSRGELAGMLGQGRQAETVMVIDAGFSGQDPHGNPLVEGLQSLQSGAAPGVDSLTWMTAAGSAERAGLLPGVARPAFSYLVLGALRGWGDADGDAKVTTREATDYARGALAASSRDQSPVHYGPNAVLAVGVRETGPDLGQLALAASTGSMGGDVDFARLAEEAAAVESAERAARTHAEELRIEAQRARRLELDAAASRLKRRAAADWTALADLREMGGDGAEGLVNKYVDTYATARVTVDGVVRAVVVTQVDEARTWLVRAREAAAADPLAEPVMVAGTDLQVRSRVMGLWLDCRSLSDVTGCSNLGYRYEQGIDGLEQDASRASALYQRGCQHDSGLACSNLGVSHAMGIGVEKDPQTAVSWFRVACDLDWGRGCAFLAVSLGAGSGVDKNLDESLTWLRRGCDLEDGHSCGLLGNRHLSGKLGAPQDEAIARDLLSKACVLGEQAACESLTELYSSGGGTVVGELGSDALDTPMFSPGVSAESKVRVMGFWRDCKDRRFDACNSLGYRYELAEDGLVRDLAKASQLYLMACEQGVAMACGNLGYFYESGHGLVSDKRQAVALYTKGCDFGNGRSCGNLGLMYENGDGTRADLPQANRLHERGCELGFGASCTNLGYNYEQGIGIEQSEGSAIRYYKRGCDGGNVRGCGNLGYLLWEGDPRYQDHTAARGHLKQACDQDGVRSCNNYAIMAGDGQGGPVDHVSSNGYMKKGCDGGDANACRNLGLRHYDGSYGQPHSPSTAREYFGKACELGQEEACSDLRTRY